MSASTSPRPENGEAASKRKLRKGTRSCWECKRRKIRCFYASSRDPICVSCTRRGTSCISQEFCYDPPTGDEDVNMRGRLLRVETLLEKLIDKVLPEGLDPLDEPERPTETPMGTERGGFTHPSSAAAEPTPLPGNYMSIPARPGGHWEGAAKAPSSSYADTGFDPSEFPSMLDGKYEKICQILYTAFPSQHDTTWLVETGGAYLFLQVVCNPYSTLFSDAALPPEILSTLPPVTSHPTILARKLLQLAICLQRLEPDFDTSHLDLTDPPLEIRAKFVDLASSLVTTNETLLDSVEGLECLILEGLYLINEGNLRRAWLCFRRAVSLAQFMGFHRANPRAMKLLDLGTRVSPADTWFRIAYAERYLSLLLGLPSSICSNSFASEESMMDSTATEKMDKVQAVIAARIIERNETASYNEFATTQAIDYDLQRAAKSVPARWWDPPELRATMDPPRLLSEVLRAQSQVIHYNLLTIVHLPFMLRNGLERRYDYSKITSIYASREVLSRFVPFRGFVRVAYCCRLVDFCAFTASFALLLAHLDSHRNSFGDVLSHQRLTDRALVERAMATMDELNRVSHDALSMKTAAVVRSLLAAEADAAEGAGSYSASNVNEDDEAAASASDRPGQSFRLDIPYLGTVRIARETLVRLQAQTLASTPSVSGGSSSASARNNALTPGSSTVAPSMLGVEQSWQAGFVPPHPQQDGPPHDQIVLPLISFQNEAHGGVPHVAMPTLVAGAEDWAFQGVDATFFDSVLRGDMADQVMWDADGSWSFLQ
ncbi:Fungal transcriptional regulatory protein, N-terminal [Pleurostoma richardsiae]|uniref:Fungal transcriptional regulatory protein, N-terminal n=1 Tax=Pleurostoma richardsiae TaxID=41990 RepID=A0AA38VL17_9PEZI|nr:Fungal transcriptional regulatory protein, N-terminal [Pleurostoma richardsiae]